jgi:thioredoxin reductase (NADPH)
MASEEHGLIIVGGGPAGLTAGIYAARARLDCLLLEGQGVSGGQLGRTEIIENYPGFAEAVHGAELAARMRTQAERFGLRFATALVSGVTAEGGGFNLVADRATYRATAVIVATGTENQKLGVPGEQELYGAGVTYCATCDGPLFRDAVVAVVGGGDSAVKEGVFLTRFARKVYVIHRRDQLRAEKIIQEKAFADPKMEFVWDSVVTAILGDAEVKGLQLKNVKTGAAAELAVEGVFIYVGVTPNTALVRGVCALDERGRILTDGEMATDVPGLFAAGDCRAKAFKQVATAVGDGAAAAFAAQEYIERRGK